VIGLDFFPFDGNGDHPGFQAAIAAHGLSYAYVRASYSIYADNYGTAVHVEHASDMLDRIEAAGLVAGAYMMPDYRAGAAPAKAQVAAYLEGARLRPGRLPPIVDIEFGAKGLARAERARVAAFLGDVFAELELALPGVAKVAYCSARVCDTDDADTLAGAANAQLAECDFFVARYAFASHGNAGGEIAAEAGAKAPPVPHAGGDADNWQDHQFAGDAIRIAGFAGQCDLNRWNVLSGATPIGVRRTRALARLKSALGDAAHGSVDYDLRAYQDLRGLHVDGIGGPATYAHLAWEPMAA
jgi:hypothetical protein